MTDGSSIVVSTPATPGGSSGSGRDHVRGEREPWGPTLNSSTITAQKTPLPISNAPPGHGLKRAATVGEVSGLRRRSTIGVPAGAGAGGGTEFPATANGGDRRRDSTLSDLSFDILNTQPPESALPRSETPQTSNWQSVPLAFALLPAVGGLMFKDGNALMTDFLLLALAAVFLQWSITQPWSWYYSAQEIRVYEEAAAEAVVDYEDDDADNGEEDEVDDGDDESRDVAGVNGGKPSKRTGKGASPPGVEARELSRAAQSALRELYFHEVMALLSCFLFPLLGASMLHATRTQLSRPSEGLVSNYNLTIFLLAAEIRPVRHLLRLLEARTLHLQRIVLSNPFGSSAQPKATASQLADLAARVEELESRAVMNDELSASAVAAAAATAEQQKANGGIAGDPEARTRRREALVREARSQMQPEVDALNRAVRRYEKKQTILAVQLDSRLQMLDSRLDDALTLAAHAAKISKPCRGFWSWAGEQAAAAFMLPFRGLWALAALPWRVLSVALGHDRRATDRSSRGYRSGRSSRSSSIGTDRFPARLSRR